MREYYACACTVVDGRLKVYNRDAMEMALYRIPNGLDLELIVQEQVRRRTNAQNRFFHGPVINAFVTLGMDRAEAKTELCLRFLPHEHHRPDGTVTIVPGHTSDLNVEQFNAFIESCIQLAAEIGVVVLDADQWRAARAAEVQRMIDSAAAVGTRA